MSGFEIKKSVGVRLFIVGLLTILLLIPTIMIRMLISERKDRRDEVANEISRNWGARQTLIGPVLSIPCRFQYYDDQRNIVKGVRYAHFLPESLSVDGIINPEMRNRGIYDIVVYDCALDISAIFVSPDFDELDIRPDDILWEDATVSFGIADLKGVRDAITFNWNGEEVDAKPATATRDMATAGVGIPVVLDGTAGQHNFSTKLNLNGSFELLFAPVGKETSVKLTSGWKNPSFAGDYLPIDREVNENGFNSHWRVLHVSRDFPQKWTGSQYEIGKSVFGVNLLLSVDQYQMTMRTVKYAILFIGLTFLAFFVIEILSGKAIHPIQYSLIGLALLLFYTLLLSLSEYIAFKYAYLIASGAVVVMISLYSRSVVTDRLRSWIVAVILTILYGYLYIVLQLQDYALLMGSLICFVALALMMYLTRKIDWFSVLTERNSES